MLVHGTGACTESCRVAAVLAICGFIAAPVDTRARPLAQTRPRALGDTMASLELAWIPMPYSVVPPPGRKAERVLRIIWIARALAATGCMRPSIALAVAALVMGCAQQKPPDPVPAKTSTHYILTDHCARRLSMGPTASDRLRRHGFMVVRDGCRRKVPIALTPVQSSR